MAVDKFLVMAVSRYYVEYPSAEESEVITYLKSIGYTNVDYEVLNRTRQTMSVDSQ